MTRFGNGAGEREPRALLFSAMALPSAREPGRTDVGLDTMGLLGSVGLAELFWFRNGGSRSPRLATRPRIRDALLGSSPLPEDVNERERVRGR